jgi:hypothetical protein
MSISVILILIWLHFVADFIFQTDKMAMSKSGSFKWLSIHVAIYSAFFLFFGWKFALFTFACHWITDALSSRATTYLYKKGQRHNFFVVIGLDQALHYTALILGYQYLVIS